MRCVVCLRVEPTTVARWPPGKTGRPIRVCATCGKVIAMEEREFGETRKPSQARRALPSACTQCRRSTSQEGGEGTVRRREAPHQCTCIGCPVREPCSGGCSQCRHLEYEEKR